MENHVRPRQGQSCPDKDKISEQGQERILIQKQAAARFSDLWLMIRFKNIFTNLQRMLKVCQASCWCIRYKKNNFAMIFFAFSISNKAPLAIPLVSCAMQKFTGEVKHLFWTNKISSFDKYQLQFIQINFPLARGKKAWPVLELNCSQSLFYFVPHQEIWQPSRQAVAGDKHLLASQGALGGLAFLVGSSSIESTYSCALQCYLHLWRYLSIL